MTTASGADPFAAATLQMLFPAAGGASQDDPRSFLAIPSGSAPRYLVPIRPSRAAAAMVGRQLLGGRARTRAARAVTVVALRSGLAGAFWPSRISAPPSRDADSVLGWLSERLAVPEVLVSVSIGRPRANRKPVLQVTDPDGRLLGFAKVGHNDLTRRLVQAEGEALRTLRAAPNRLVQVPALVAQEPWHDLELLLMSALPIPRGAVSGAVDRALLYQAVLEIAQITGQDLRPWSAHPFAARMRGGLAGLGDKGSGLQDAVDRLEEAEPTLAYGSWHGDLNPGNLAVVGKRMLVWDWERFEAGVPIGFDLVHHDLQQSVTVRSEDPQQAARRMLDDAPALLAPLGVEPAQAPWVALSYLVWLAIRLLSDRQAEAGASLGNVDQWLLPVIGVPALGKGVH